MKRTLWAALFIGAASVCGFSQAQISGRVTYGNETPLHDVSVQIVQTRQEARTDAEGNYRFLNLSAGRYTVLVHAEGFADVARTVVVTTGTEKVENFRLDIAALREQVTVTASGTEQSVFESFQSVNSVSSARITERAGPSLGEVLDAETGINKRSFGPGSSRPVIRGFDGDRVLVLQDGLRTASLGSQSADHGEPVDPLAAERIEVVKGPGTLLYGSNALGGVVNVISNDENTAHEGVRGFATVLGNSADRQAAFASGIEYGIGKVLLRGNFGAQRAGDISTPLGRIPNSASRSHSGSGSIGYFGDKAYIAGTFFADIRRYGIPFAALFHEHDEEDEERPAGELPEVDEEVDIRMRNRKFRLNGGFRDLSGPVRGVQYNLDLTDYRHKEIELEGNVGTVGTTFDNDVLSYRSLFEQQRAGRLTGRFGFEGFDREYRVTGEEALINGKVDHRSFSAFALEELDFERVRFQFGGRIENNRYRPEDPALRSRSFTGFSGGAGINVGLWSGGSFVANFTHADRAPALEELYNNGPHIGNLRFEIGNEDLGRERSNGIDLALRHQSQRVRFTGDVFYYRIQNFIFLAPVDDDGDGETDEDHGLPVGRYSVGNARFVGAELNADITLNRILGAFVGFDMVRANLRETDIDLPRIPPARLRAGLDIRFGGLSLRPETLLVSRQDRIFPLETETPGYVLFNVAGSYTWARTHYAHIISFNAYNLTDKLYRNHLSFIKDLAPEPGRGIRVGYTIRFF
jgi:iron complex outermembrane recepter protein